MSNKVLNKIKHRAKAVESKWTRGDRSALAVNAIGDDLLRQSTTLVLENIDTDNGAVVNPLIEEAASTIGGFQDAGSLGLGSVNGGINQNSSMYRPLSLALARRVYPSLFAHKIVGVQPMAAPVGMAFAMRNYYSKVDGGKTILGETEAAWESIPEYTAHHGADYTVLAGDDITLALFKSSVNYTVNADLTGPAVYNALELTLAAGDISGAYAGLSVDDVIAANTVVASTPGDLYAAQTGIEGNFQAAIPTSDAELLGVSGVDGSTAAGQQPFQEIGIKWDQKTISADERPMAASFSLQSMQDIKALHEIDLKAEVMDTLQYESTAQLDRELLTEIKKTSIDTSEDIKGGEVLQVNLLNNASTDPQDNRQMTAILVNSILFASNTVAKYTKRGKANFVIVSNKVATVLQAAVPFFTPVTTKVDAGIILSGSESTEIGMINGFLTVYIDQFAKVDYALVGYKGEGKVSDSGVIFSPYIMGLKHEAIAQDNFQPRVGVTSRYAITTGLIDAGAYYRSLVFTGLDNVIIGTSAKAGKGWN